MTTLHNPELTIKSIRVNDQLGRTITLEYYGSAEPKTVPVQHPLLARVNPDHPMARYTTVGAVIDNNLQPGVYSFPEFGKGVVVEYEETVELLRKGIERGDVTALIKSIKTDEESGTFNLEYHNTGRSGTVMPQTELYVFDKLDASLKTMLIGEVVDRFGKDGVCEFAQDDHIQVAVEPGPAAKIRFAHYWEVSRQTGKVVQRGSGYAYEYSAYDLDDKPFKVLEDIDTKDIVVIDTVVPSAAPGTYLINGLIIEDGRESVLTYPIARDQAIGRTSLANIHAYFELCAKEGTIPAVEPVLAKTLPQALVDVNEYPLTVSKHNEATDTFEMHRTYTDYKCQPYQVVAQLQKHPLGYGDFQGDATDKPITTLDRLKARKVGASKWAEIEKAFVEGRARYFGNVCDVANELLTGVVNTKALLAMDFDRASDLLARVLAARWKATQNPAERAKIEEVWAYAADSVAARAFTKDIETTATGLLTKEDIESVFIDK